MERKSKLKILFLGWEYPPFNAGGLGVACQGLAEALGQKAMDIFFVLPQKIDVFSRWLKFIFLGIDFSGKPAFYYSYQSFAHKSFKNKSGQVIFHQNILINKVFSYANEISKLQLNFEPDLIYAHDWLTFPAAFAARKKLNKPVVLHIHATEFDRAGGKMGDPLVHDIEREGLKKADKIIAVSDFTKRKIIDLYGIDGRKIEVVHNALTKNNYSNQEESLSFVKNHPVVLFVGRLTLHKGVDWFLYAAKRVLDVEPKTLFMIVGDGELKGRLLELAVNLGIDRNVIFTGFLRDEKLSQLYKIADLYVLPSVSEPFGIAALEALSHGVPVMVSRTSGVAEVLKGALEINFWDVEKMAAKILAVLNYRELQKALACDGQKDLYKLSWERAADKIEKIFGELNHIQI